MAERLPIESIAHEYEQTIILPPSRPRTQYILCPVGLVGAGKTTVMKPLAERLRLVRISSDDIRKLLKESGMGFDSVGDIVEALGKKYLRQGHSLALDMDCAGTTGSRILKEAVAVYHTKPVWIHINPPEEFILKKLASLKPNWLGTAEEMIANYYERKPLHQNLAFPFVYTFDTSKENLPDQIEEAARIIEGSMRL